MSLLLLAVHKTPLLWRPALKKRGTASLKSQADTKNSGPFSKNFVLAFIILTGILGTCEKSWNCLFVARMCLSIIQPCQYSCSEQQKQADKACALSTDTPVRLLKTSSGQTCSLLQIHEENRKPYTAHLRGNFTYLHKHLGHLTYKDTHLTTGNKISGQFSKRTIASKTC